MQRLNLGCGAPDLLTGDRLFTAGAPTAAERLLRNRAVGQVLPGQIRLAAADVAFLDAHRAVGGETPPVLIGSNCCASLYVRPLRDVASMPIHVFLKAELQSQIIYHV